MKNLVKQLALGSVLVGLTTGAIACTPTGESTGESTAKVEVRPVYAQTESIFQMDVVSIGLEELGYDVKKALNIVDSAMHVAIGNGDSDYTAGHWYPQQKQFFENGGGAEKMTRLGVLVDGCLQGYAIDKKTADAYNIKNIADLKKPEIAKLFDTDGDGKANLIGCDAGWRCEGIIEHHLEAYDLRDTVEQQRGSYFALMADAIARYDGGEPLLYYTWTPIWMNAILRQGEDVVWLEVPFTSLPADYAEQATDVKVDGKNLGFSINQMRIVANNEFLNENPTAKRFFELAQIPIEDVDAQNLLMYNGENSLEDIRRHAEEWVAKNQELFDGWVAEARRVDR